MRDRCSCQLCPKHEWEAEPLAGAPAEVCFLLQGRRFEFHVIFCINWLYTEKQTWMFTSSWSERGFDVTSKELLNLCLMALVQSSYIEVGAGGASFYAWKSLANISPFQVGCRRVIELLSFPVWRDIVVAGCFGIETFLFSCVIASQNINMSLCSVSSFLCLFLVRVCVQRPCSPLYSCLLQSSASHGSPVVLDFVQARSATFALKLRSSLASFRGTGAFVGVLAVEENWAII